MMFKTTSITTIVSPNGKTALGVRRHKPILSNFKSYKFTNLRCSHDLNLLHEFSEHLASPKMNADGHLSNEFVWNNKNASISKHEMNIQSSETF
jgi:hypothetical protein